MGRDDKQLTQKQVEVLRWIRDGCPDSAYKGGYDHRITARALERRGLVAITGRGATWSATVTAAGQAWEPPPDAPSPPGPSDADQLIARVLAADGRLLLPEDRQLEQAHDVLVRRSLNSSSRPHGKRLEIRSTGRWGSSPKEIVFVEHFDDYVETTPVPVPERIGKYHPVVKEYLRDKEWQCVTTEYVPRAARILQALAAEALKRGMKVLQPAEAARRDHNGSQRALERTHLVLEAPAGLYSVKIREICASGVKRVERRPWNVRKTKPAWLDERGWEFVSTGKLEVVVNGPRTGYNGTPYRDAKTVTVEDKLPEIFRSLEIYQLQAEWQERENQRKKAERQRQWEAAMVQARGRYEEHVRWEHFKERSREWQSVRQHRKFIAAIRPMVENLDGTERVDVLTQLELAESVLNELDVTKQPERLIPQVQDPKTDDLKPFLNGWSPYGPDGQAW